MATNSYPKEIPMVRSLLMLMPRIQKEQKILGCQVKAIIKYHETCATAAKKLAEDLERCNLLQVNVKDSISKK